MVNPAPTFCHSHVPYDVFDTIKSLMLQGLTREEAISKVESLLRTKLPEEIKERL